MQLVEQLGHGQIERRIAEKLEALVAAAAVDFVRVRGVGEREGCDVAIAEAVFQALRKRLDDCSVPVRIRARRFRLGATRSVARAPPAVPGNS
jgi:succinyl-CoA synthetase beta subunit